MAALLAGSALALPAVVPAQVQEIESVIVEEGVDASVSDGDVMIDADGSRYVLGRFDGVVEFGEGPDAQVLNGTDGDLFVAKYDADGNLQWIQDFETESGGGGFPRATPGGIAFDSSQNQIENDVYVAGSFTRGLRVGGQTLTSDSQPDGFVARFNFGGQMLDLQQIVGAFLNIVVHVVQDERGLDTCVAGSFLDTVTIGSTTLRSRGDADTYLARFNSFGGSVERVIHIGGEGVDILHRPTSSRRWRCRPRNSWTSIPSTCLTTRRRPPGSRPAQARSQGESSRTVTVGR